MSKPDTVDVRGRSRRSAMLGRLATVRRFCPGCRYAWDSRTFYGAGDETVCPRCGAPVPGDSYARGRG